MKIVQTGVFSSVFVLTGQHMQSPRTYKKGLLVYNNKTPIINHLTLLKRQKLELSPMGQPFLCSDMPDRE